MANARRIFDIETTEVEFDGAVYFVPEYARHRPVCRKILAGQYAEPELHTFVEQVMARGGSMVHAGTFFGDMLPSFSRKTPGKVYAFEPVLENYLLAHAIVDTNDLGNVMLMHAGLGEAPGVALVETGGVDGVHRGGSSRVLDKAMDEFNRPQRIPILSIDQFGIEDVTLIQLDVEGFELDVLRGAIKTLRTHEPVLVLEDYQKNCAPFLEELGYEPHEKVSGNQVYLTTARAVQLGRTPAAARTSRLGRFIGRR